MDASTLWWTIGQDLCNQSHQIIMASHNIKIMCMNIDESFFKKIHSSVMIVSTGHTKIFLKVCIDGSDIWYKLSTGTCTARSMFHLSRQRMRAAIGRYFSFQRIARGSPLET